MEEKSKFFTQEGYSPQAEKRKRIELMVSFIEACRKTQEKIKKAYEEKAKKAYDYWESHIRATESKIEDMLK